MRSVAGSRAVGGRRGRQLRGYGAVGCGLLPGHRHRPRGALGVRSKVIVRPVLDLNAELSTDAYEPTEPMKEQLRLRYRECVFPSCHRQSRFCDADHIVPWPVGPTASWNLAPLCRTPPPSEDPRRLGLRIRARGRVHLDRPPRPPTYRLTATPPTTAGGVTDLSAHVPGTLRAATTTVDHPRRASRRRTATILR